MSSRNRERRNGKSLKRSKESRSELRTVVVYTEGKNSEPDYVNGLMKLPHIAEDTTLNIELVPEHGVPLTLVRKAVVRSKEPETDECWCLFDVEWPLNHPNLREAIELAKAHNIRLAISNPCFEIWLTLHHKNQNSFCENDAAERESMSIDGRKGKSIDAEVYIPLRRDAVRRAEKLEKQHASAQTKFPHDNPSSSMYQFVRYLDKFLDA